MKPKFNDYFSKQSAVYAKFRPQYPIKLFDYLASLCAERKIAWDCATGSGQAARGLTPYFDQIFATDGSSEQLAQAFQDPKIKYSVALSENSQLASKSIDLITVGTQRYIEENRKDPRDLIRADLEEIYKRAGGTIETTVPLDLRVGRNI